MESRRRLPRLPVEIADSIPAFVSPSHDDRSRHSREEHARPTRAICLGGDGASREMLIGPRFVPWTTGGTASRDAADEGSFAKNASPGVELVHGYT